MIRGIERTSIFRDDRDRDEFVNRLAALLPEAKTACYASAFIPNHAHFLFRSGPTGMASLMRKLLTGYAVYFNHRHKRSGQLFQNRYKSIICQEHPYLVELVR
jgi:putative transposase